MDKIEPNLKLTETKCNMYLAQEKLVKLISNLLHDKPVNHEDFEVLSEVNSAISDGINYLEYVG